MLSRITLTILVRYISLEEERFAESRSTLPDDDDSSTDGDGVLITNGVLTTDVFAQQHHAAYQASVVFTLNQILGFTDNQFVLNSKWIIPLVARAVICADIDVRICVRDIYKRFVNDLALR